MNTHRLEQRGRWLCIGATTALVVLACARLPQEPQQEPTGLPETLEQAQTLSQPSRSSQAAQSGAVDALSRLAEVTVTASSVAGARAMRGADVSPLSRAAPGDELWIIDTSRAAAEGPDARDDATPGSGAMLASFRPRGLGRDGETQMIPLPLEHTAVRAAVVGYVGTVDVTQQFANPFDEKIEAVYMFPLPEKSAVSEFVMTIGERRIRGILRERTQAEQIYREARAQGFQASLLTQMRPNIFEQKVANIEPGKRIDVEIRYFHTLAYDDGWYSWVFPTVVGPRYNPPGSADPVLALPRTESGWAQAAVRYLRPNERSGHDISITVDVDAGVAIEAITASHGIVETRTSASSARVALANQATVPNKDFVLRFRVAGETIKSSLLTYRDAETDQGYFTLMMYPPADLERLERQPLELVFVLDCSGSMQGEPLAQAKDAVLAALDRLEPEDTFQIIQFSMRASQLGPTPVAATPENVRRARQYVHGLQGSGGTQMIEGIKAALDFPHDATRLRFVTFLTDGYIGNELEILGEIHARLGASRVFSFGVGSSVNRYLLERMASEGRGAVAFLSLEDSGREVMDFFFARISHPALIDVEIDWGRMRVSDVYPSRLPDLFVGRPVIVTGKFSGAPGVPTARGNAVGRRLALELPYDAAGPEHEFIPRLWARLRIADLADRQAWDDDPANELGLAIKNTALEYGLMSNYTAFVAVDASQATEGDHGTTVFQAVPVPDGVRYETTVTR